AVVDAEVLKAAVRLVVRSRLVVHALIADLDVMRTGNVRQRRAPVVLAGPVVRVQSRLTVYQAGNAAIGCTADGALLEDVHQRRIERAVGAWPVAPALVVRAVAGFEEQLGRERQLPRRLCNVRRQRVLGEGRFYRRGWRAACHDVAGTRTTDAPPLVVEVAGELAPPGGCRQAHRTGDDLVVGDRLRGGGDVCDCRRIPDVGVRKQREVVVGAHGP